MPFPVCGFYDHSNHPRLHIDKRCKTRQQVLDTLAHEMIHQYQHEYGLNVNHGNWFRKEAKRLKAYGLIV